jgi:hypothetical protein
MLNLELPVSIGEAVDKLTILDIKLEKITDARKNDVKKEYDMLYIHLEPIIIKYNDLYQTMKRVNLIIWDQMDILRDGNVDEAQYLKKCKECIEYNDIRFRVKNKINYVSNSSLKEQKSYKINRILIEINNEIQNISDFLKPIKYYSFIYDEIVIISNNVELKTTFEYDQTIIFNDTKSLENSKKQFVFTNNFYDNAEILTIFELDDDVIKMIL